MLIGICGAAGCGKDAAASVLIRERGYTLHKFAGPLYEMVSVMTGLSVEDLMDRKIKEKPLAGFGGKSPRQILQTLGTDWGRSMVASDVWIQSVAARARPLLEAGKGVVITDLRFDNEADWIRSEGGEVWRVERVVPRDVACLSPHTSEAGVDDARIDRTIRNDGTLEDLRRAVLEDAMGLCGQPG